ncbi:DUF192 domain-containing protein [Myxococcus sp. RHSTA-1-4]|uniref:DUF192 domain-containing protein n=1 Tax=Myxococcus sp. RHSTA-1-4 TaxID=2874601 RepID=UPI001CBCFCB4|nr:DUF192 domain-containing protein [Myxococcus sp. RHSTA-1-4]MBZ4418258.1 DUF192 domain-containing protein [Myxococcus sp. RHSTA-1-4]
MRWRVNNETRQRLLADRAERATGFLHRFKGLMGRRSLAVGEGLHILPCNSIHTFFMRIPIDVAFLDAQGVIVKQLSALPPWRATSVYFQSRSVLELPAGVLEASGTREGDRLSFEPVSQPPTPHFPA